MHFCHKAKKFRDSKFNPFTPNKSVLKIIETNIFFYVGLPWIKKIFFYL